MAWNPVFAWSRPDLVLAQSGAEFGAAKKPKRAPPIPMCEPWQIALYARMRVLERYIARTRALEAKIAAAEKAIAERARSVRGALAGTEFGASDFASAFVAAWNPYWQFRTFALQAGAAPAGDAFGADEDEDRDEREPPKKRLPKIPPLLPPPHCLPFLPKLKQVEDRLGKQERIVAERIATLKKLRAQLERAAAVVREGEDAAQGADPRRHRPAPEPGGRPEVRPGRMRPDRRAGP